MIRRISLVVFGLLGVVACAPTTTPRIRVAADLGCNVDDTTIVRLDERRWRVSGCGRTAIYLCTYPVRDCWREGDIHME